MTAPSFQLPHHAIGSLAGPDPSAAFVGAGLLFLPGRPSPAHLGAARNGRASFFPARGRLSCKIVGPERHHTAPASTLRARHQMSMWSSPDGEEISCDG